MSLLDDGSLDPPVDPGNATTAGDPSEGARTPLEPGTRLGDYTLRRWLGRGGMGVVYEATDDRRGDRVALKTLSGLGPSALLRFKREFRSLAGVNHPNIVALHELVFAEERVFLTMDLVEGCDVLTYVRGGPDGPVGLDLHRLRATLTQLAEGLQALHALGMVHRDIKPSNVLVDQTGRVVIVDFGLVSDDAEEEGSAPGTIIGTPAYMPPEQAAGLTQGAPGDWYSVGLILFEAVAGQLPFRGRNVVELLAARQVREPPRPSALVNGVPADLDQLAYDLLRRHPADRPTGREILARLGNVAAPPASASRAEGVTEHLFLGRQAEVAAFDDALAALHAGRAVTVVMRGPSGIGKSALLRNVLDRYRADPRVVCLMGRCYERESVPYKAVDSLVDALCRHLVGLEPEQAEALLPLERGSLGRLFPVLLQVEGVARARFASDSVLEPRELRRRGFAALREVLTRLATRAPLVLALDDLQWGDVDSAALLASILGPPRPPPLLLIASFRSEEVAESPFLRAFLADLAARDAVDCREVMVAALGPDRAEELARALLGIGPATVTLLARSVARESRGNPFFLLELSRHVLASEGSERSKLESNLSLESVLGARIERLPGEVRRLLEVVAVASRPIDERVAALASEVRGAERRSLRILESEHLIRTCGSERPELIEVYHDKIREVVTRSLDPARLRLHHLRLATTLESTRHADPELLASHFLGAGERERAGEYAFSAAVDAARALAFDRAARLYRFSLDLRPALGPEKRGVLARLAEALANAGRGRESATVYLEAALGGTPEEALERRRLAAEQFLRSGHVDEGLPVLDMVLGAVGMRMPRSPRGALIGLLARRLAVRLRGLRFVEREAARISPAALARIDLCWSVSAGLGIVDPIRAMDFMARSLLLSLRVGEPYRVARALAMEAGALATRGGRSAARAGRVLAVAEGLARRVGHPHALGLVALTGGIASYFQGRFGQGLERCTEAEARLREWPGATWDLASARLFTLQCLVYLGAMGEVIGRFPALLREAQERGDRYAATSLLALPGHMYFLACDEPEAARGQLREAMAGWSRQSFHAQHYWELLAHGQIDLYGGDASVVQDRLERDWPKLERSLLPRLQLIRIVMVNLRARSALAAAEGQLGSRRDEGVRSAARDAGRLEGERMPWSDPLARAVRAGCDALGGRLEPAARHLAAAEVGFQRAGMELHAAVARRQLGLLTGGAAGRDLVGRSDAYFSRERVGNPARMAALLLPGFAGTTGRGG